MATILITGAGGACGIGAIKSLKTNTAHRVIGVDMDPTAVGIQFADAGRTVPPATDDEWPTAIASIVSEFDVDVIIPTVDEELAVLPALRDVCDDVPILAPKQAVIDLAMDKYQATKALAEAGHPTPATWLGTEADAIAPSTYPLIVKPRRGRGSRGVQRVETPDELHAHLADTSDSPDTLLCQALVDGTEYTTSVVGTTQDELLSVVPKEAIEKDGSTVLGATRTAPAVASSCVEIFETLAPAGPLNIQQIVDEDGIPRVIEINPRFSSTSCLTVDAGVDAFDLLIRDALGQQVDPPESFEPDRYIVRYEDHLFVDEEELLDESELQSTEPPQQ